MRITLSGLLAALCFLIAASVPLIGNYALVCGPGWLYEGGVMGSCVCFFLLFVVGGFFFASPEKN